MRCVARRDPTVDQRSSDVTATPGNGVRSSLLVFLVLSNALLDHADGRVMETEEISYCLKRVLVGAGGCVDLPVTCLLVSSLGEELFKTRPGGEP